jgi:capsule polysaccharide export protein KpsE/RkpR
MADEVIQPDDIAIEPAESRQELDGAARKRAASETSAARWRLIWSYRRFVLRVTGIGLLLSVLIAFLIPARFQSTARLMPPDQGSSGMGLAMLAAGGGGLGTELGSGLGSMGSSLGNIAGDLLGIKNSSDLFVGILQSRTVQDDLINKFDLRKVYSDGKMEDARDDLTKHTDLSADRKTGIVMIQVVDHNPKRAAGMAEEYLTELNLVVNQLNTSAAHRERVFLEERLSQVKQDLESAENNFSQFASKNTAIDVPAQGRAMIEAAANLEGQLIAAQTELQGLKQLYSDGNVRVRSTRARVDEIQRQLQKLGGKFDDVPGSSSEKEDDSMYPSIRQLPVLGVSYADLFRNTKIQETLFASMTQQYELAKVEEAKETPSIKVLDPPDIPDKKSFPPRLVIVVLGTMLAIAGSITWIFGKQSWDQVAPGDPQKVLAQEIMHTVRVRMPWAPANGSGPDSNGQGRVRRSQDKTQGDL